MLSAIGKTNNGNQNRYHHPISCIGCVRFGCSFLRWLERQTFLLCLRFIITHKSCSLMWNIFSIEEAWTPGLPGKHFSMPLFIPAGHHGPPEKMSSSTTTWMALLHSKLVIHFVEGGCFKRFLLFTLKHTMVGISRKWRLLWNYFKIKLKNTTSIRSFNSFVQRPQTKRPRHPQLSHNGVRRAVACHKKNLNECQPQTFTSLLIYCKEGFSQRERFPPKL